MTLTEIYKENAAYVRRSGYVVRVDEPFSWVAIEDGEGADVFLEGAIAEEFIAGARRAWEEAGGLTLEDAFYGHAKSWVEVLA
ncbi:hypothetical protein D9M71_510010 [compost metagenome]